MDKDKTEEKKGMGDHYNDFAGVNFEVKKKNQQSSMQTTQKMLVFLFARLNEAQAALERSLPRKKSEVSLIGGSTQFFAELMMPLSPPRLADEVKFISCQSHVFG